MWKELAAMAAGIPNRGARGVVSTMIFSAARRAFSWLSAMTDGEELAVILDGVFGKKWFVVAGRAGVVRTGHVIGGEDGLHAWLRQVPR